jgi:hypothetical protein
MNGVLRAVIVGAVCMPAVCAAQQAARPKSGFDYSYVELEYADTEFDVSDGGNIDGDGFTLRGSIELSDEWHAFASYGQSDLDFGIDLDTFTIGAGYVYPLKDDLDLYGRVMYIKEDVDFPSPFADPDDDGLGLQVRVRGRINPNFEVEGGIQYLHIDNSDTSLQAEGRYYFTNEFSVGVGLTFAGDADGLGVSVRYTF